MSEPRRHHYVPAFYLSQFATPTERDGRLRVFDRTSGRVYGSSPDGVAHARDFYQVESDKGGNVVEKAFADLEGKCAPILTTLNQQGRIPNAEDLGTLLSIVAFQAVRIPGVRNKFQKFRSDLMMRILAMSASDKEVLRNEALAINPNWTDADVDQLHDELTEFLQQPGARVEFDRTTLVYDALDTAPTIGKELAKRKWSLGIAPADVPLITSDNPVVFMWALDSTPPPNWSPGFGRVDTLVGIALGPHYFLFGSAHSPKEAEFEMSVEHSAHLNTVIALHADERLFFRGEGFRHLSKAATVVDGPTDELRIAAG